MLHPVRISNQFPKNNEFFALTKRYNIISITKYNIEFVLKELCATENDLLYMALKICNKFPTSNKSLTPMKK